MCKGADAQFFNGHTNITSSRFLVFGVKGLLGAAKNVRNAMLFNILSFLSDKLLTEGYMALMREQKRQNALLSVLAILVAGLLVLVLNR